ncbi:putative bifunctional diguanylate cyclase/phosphodiesterase [Aquipuribacter sp. MA13-6]|uniref:putative bifunctional diguanylate cyclase/phosphodiesterase n=1 Tax=unclassified Aquipuribacter TaxID=2635084 RepID=UPI003EEB305B
MSDAVAGATRALVCLVLAPAAVLAVVLVARQDADPDVTGPGRNALLAALLVVYALALCVRGLRSTGAERRAWLVAASLAPLGGLVVVTGDHGAHTWGAVARGAVYLLLLGALALSPGVRRSADRALMLVLDGWALTVGPFVLLLAAAAAAPRPGGAGLLGAVEPLVGLWVLLDLVALALFVGLLRQSRAGHRSALVPLVLSMFAAVLADTITWRRGMSGDFDVASDAAWAFAIVCAAAAAIGTRPLFGTAAGGPRGVGRSRAGDEVLGEASHTWLPSVVAGTVILLLAVRWSTGFWPAAGPQPEVVLLALSLVVAVVAQTGLLLRDQSRLAHRLHETSTRFRTIVDGSTDVVLVCGADGVVRFVSPASRAVLGLEPDELDGRPLLELAHAADRATLEEALARGFAGTADVVDRVRLTRAGGGWRHVEVRLQPHDTPAVPGGLTLVLRDVSERVRMQRELERRARLDSLTGLPNRWWFGRTLALRLAEDAPTAVVFIDLDEFKAVNDTEGHAVGDRLLVAAARRLRFAVGDDDVVGRLSGDEFAVMVCDDDVDRVRLVADRVLQEVAMPYAVGTRRIRIAASIGLAVATPGSDADTVLRDADLAMYEAKRSGGERVVVSHPAMLQAAVDRTELDRRVRAAVEDDDLELVYQPMVDLTDGRVVAAEALLRWPGSGVSPVDFVPRLEQTGLIVEVGASVLERAVEQAARWHRDGRTTSISVNLSPLQLVDDDLVSRVRRVLAVNGLPPQRLTLEVTESLLLRDLDASVELLSRLRATGVRVALDDFGTGYSSLAYLHRLPIDVLKVDRAFVRAAAVSRRDLVVLRSIVALGRDLGLAVVAEGVQDVAQVELLLQLGCRVAQGFLLAGPSRADVVPERVLVPRGTGPGRVAELAGMRDDVSNVETESGRT